MFLGVFFGKFKMRGVFVLLVVACFYPQYRYQVVDREKLVDIPGYELSKYWTTRVILPDSETLVVVDVKRARWEDGARWFSTHDQMVGENCSDSSGAGQLRFRRHNLNVSLSFPSQPSVSDHRKIIELARSIDKRIQSLEGTKISIDTIGNRAFLAHIKPMFLRDGIFSEETYDDLRKGISVWRVRR